MTFIQDALKTKSDKFYNTQVSKDVVLDTLENCTGTLQFLDAIKKKLFYNKPNEDLDKMSSLYGDSWSNTYTPEQIDLIHAILGIATEAGELLEALTKFIDEEQDFDLVNLKEECGDIFWYQAILANSTNNTFEGIQNTVIAKLKARFPDNFTEKHANNRDLETERKILEQ